MLSGLAPSRTAAWALAAKARMFLDDGDVVYAIPTLGKGTRDLCVPARR
jgi:hypothetical protein